MEWLDPVEFTKGTMTPPNSDAPPTEHPGPALYNEMPSPFWGDEIVWKSTGGASRRAGNRFQRAVVVYGEAFHSAELVRQGL